MDRRDRAGGFILEHRFGSVELSRVAPDLVLIVFSGVCPVEINPPLFEVLGAAIAHHAPIRVFVDASALKSYTTPFRKEWTAWVRSNRPHLVEMQMLVKSKLVEMGLNLANPLMGNFVVGHSKTDSFRRAMERATSSA